MKPMYIAMIVATVVVIAVAIAHHNGIGVVPMY